ncbi:MAG: hypothetical protein UAR70_01025 [Buchnera aphidicola (Chaetogeoica yunlongensis)]
MIYISKKKRYFKIKNKTFNNKRMLLLFLLITFISSVVFIRIFFLQIIQSKHLTHQSDLRSLRTRIEIIQRGNIKDRLGNLIAVSLPVKSICFDPQFFF